LKRDLYQEVTDAIVSAIESNPGDVVMPWHRGGAGQIPTNIQSGNHYNGINIINLWVTAQANGYSSSVWGTYKQWKEKDCQVRKGEKSSLVIFYKQLEWEDENGDEQKRPMIRASFSFNADQVDGFERPDLDGDSIDRIQAADEFVSRTRATIIPGGATACYRKSTDTVHMPDEQRFFDTETFSRTEAYYSTLFHELTHYTGIKSRCDRDMGKRFGSEAYAMEELVAELGAAFQCAWLGIEAEPRIDHAQYLSNWLQVLKDDKKAIFTAAAKAQEAVNFLKAQAEQEIAA
jgi:antirestriction protein ArdC